LMTQIDDIYINTPKYTYVFTHAYTSIYIHTYTTIPVVKEYYYTPFDDSDWWPMTIDDPSLYMNIYKHINKYINKYINKCVQDIHTIVLIYT
jgi:hypothetical protein